MVENTIPKRSPGRPLGFDPDEALDKAIMVFWQNGYAGADTETLAHAMGVTKPSIYGTFGSKEELFLKVLRHYADTYGRRVLTALVEATDIEQGVQAFFDVAVENMCSDDGPSGCLISCVAAQVAPTMPRVAEFTHAGLLATDIAIAERFQDAVAHGALRPDFPVAERAALMSDLMQGLSLRARSGFGKADVKRSAKTAGATILG